MMQQLIMKKKNIAASQVQKVLKGFITRKNVFHLVVQKRLNESLEYFQKKRVELLTDS